jgi:hypothetical protein
MQRTSEAAMTPEDLPGRLGIESLFPWLSAIEPGEPAAARPLRPRREDEPPDQDVERAA